MATIDPNIALGVKPLQIENPMNQYAAMSQIQNAQNQNALAQYQLSSAKRAEESQNIQNQLYAKHYNAETGQVNKQGLMADLAAQNQGVLIPKLQAQFTEEEHKQNLNKKVTAETTGLQYTQQMKQYNNAISHIGALNTPQEAIASIKESLAKGDIDQAKADTLVKSLSAAPNFLDWKKKIVLGSMEGKDQLHQQYQEATLAETGRHNIKTEGLQQQGVNIQGARLGLEQNKANREQTMGTIPSGYRLNKQTNELEAIPGGPTTVALAPKELQKRETTFPQATSAVKAIETKSDSFIRDLEKLRDHPGLNQITGLVQGRLPGVTGEGRAAQALYDKIVAKGGFQALQDLRDASKTGGALGNVSNQEGKQLTASFAAISRVQDAKEVKAAIDQAIDDIKGTKTRVREAYDQTYEYKNKSGTNSVDDLLEKYK